MIEDGKARLKEKGFPEDSLHHENLILVGPWKERERPQSRTPSVAEGAFLAAADVDPQLERA